MVLYCKYKLNTAKHMHFHSFSTAHITSIKRQWMVHQ